MISQNLMTQGFDFIPQNHYLTHENAFSIHDLKKTFDTMLENDGADFRKRAYLKLSWNLAENAVQVAENQSYYQSKLS